MKFHCIVFLSIETLQFQGQEQATAANIKTTTVVKQSRQRNSILWRGDYSTNLMENPSKQVSGKLEIRA